MEALIFNHQFYFTIFYFTNFTTIFYLPQKLRRFFKLNCYTQEPKHHFFSVTSYVYF